LGWSEANTGLDALLASSSVEGIVVWSKQTDESLGWSGRVLTMHKVSCKRSPFNPALSLLLQLKMAGFVYGTKLQAISPGSRWCPDGFSCLAWHPKVSNLLLEVKTANCWFGQNLCGGDD